MVRAWFLSDAFMKEVGDKREPNIPDPPTFIDVKELHDRTGIEYQEYNADTIDDNEEYADMKKQRGYNYEDCCEISPAMQNYEDKLNIFYSEHLHADEEIRFCLQGRGYFDVRDKFDQWIRVEFVKDDLLILPAGIYHRFTVDTNNYIKVKRLFTGTPNWTALPRPSADSHPMRQSYVKNMEITVA